jgi:hypothetical protein
VSKHYQQLISADAALTSLQVFVNRYGLIERADSQSNETICSLRLAIANKRNIERSSSFDYISSRLSIRPILNLGLNDLLGLFDTHELDSVFHPTRVLPYTIGYTKLRFLKIN